MDKREYRSLTIPKLTWNKKDLTDTFGELVAQPLEPGFGNTLGNALRRVLLGGVEGSAVTSIIIKGVNNEFSSLPGVVEDVMQIVLNCKEIVVRNKEGRSGKMSISVTSAGAVRAGDLQTDDYLEVVNGDHIIAHVSEGGSLDMEFFVETGRGYQVAQWPIGQALQKDGRIYLDAMFSPIKKVMFDVEKTRVGGEIDYDKLILRVTTDGSENPLEVVHYSVSVLRTQLEHFLKSAEIPFNEISQVPEQDVVVEQEPSSDNGLKGVPVDLLLKPIDELELSVRAHNCLINAGITRVIDLVNLNDEDGLKIKNFGRKSLDEVRDSMKSFNLSFGMDIKEADAKRALQERGIQESVESQ